MINITNLVKCYGKKTVLDHLSLKIKAGTIFGLLGPNGAGKTTLISILNGLLGYSEGQISIFDLPHQANQREICRRSSLIPQNLAFYENLTIKENLEFFGRIQNNNSGILKRNISKAIDINRLGSMVGQRASTLSGGEKRRLNLAIGLLNDPDILFFDEPTIGIDSQSRNEILEIIKSFKDADKTVIYTTHYIPEVEKICDEVAIINAGKVIRQGKIENILNERNTNQVIIDIFETHLANLQDVSDKIEELKVIDEFSILLESSNSTLIYKSLELLENKNISVKQIRYQTTSLESLFIDLTNKEKISV